MNLLSVNQLSKSYGTKVLFNKINFGVNYGDKVALVAKNGSGKTTLFKILKGIEIADEGEVVFRKNISVAFLDQNFSLDQQQTIQQLIENADNPYVKCIKAYEHAVQLSVDEPGDKSAQLMDEALNQMNELNAWEYETNLKEILSRLELNDLSQTIHTLSGGQQKRVALALVLINKPDLVIMDEPTNHLDIDMIEWLEHYLQNASLSLLLVTHDRYFLDEVCNSIIELERGEIVEYKGNFEYYLTKKAEREAIKAAEIDKAKNLYKRELEWVRKMPKARTTKSKSRVDAFYDIEEKAKQKRVDKKIELSVKMERLGSKIVELIKVSKAFGNKVILNPFTYTFMNGEKIGVVGKNGMGKSTLLKIILNELQPDSGKVQIGDTVVFGYYSQTGMQLAEDKRIIEVVKDIAEFIPLANGTSLSASALLTRFNFPPDVQYSYVSKLSGGEKRRLYLLTVLVKNPNFLILDEPTNDLDIVTLQTLEEFLDEFKGCVLIVSHDRYFMDRLVDHVFAFEGNGEIKDYPGTYTEYRIWKQEQQAVQKAEESKLQAAIAEKKEEVLLQPETNNSQKKRSYKLQKELDDLEKEIPQLEAKKKEIEAALTSTNEFERIQQLTAEFEKVNALLDEKSLRWLEIQEQ
ncbi:MAG: ABC-F family ATP-binding cassette domain-containing protein [Bacteroidetes bacterium]|jgi:ATP-binding cassette subfamily F protein uup|nr:ABC-F family ATP-binding cassette domain-containing protein [Bacteroidota bacterium]MCA6445327.1 ABC-F family ATP-binding cassette domain-containing protein [Bacteroidota bacterium]